VKLLLDENLPHKLRFSLEGHVAMTVAYSGLSGLSNGDLLAQAARLGFDALITLDAGIAEQHDPTELPVAVVVLHARSNALDDLRPLLPALLKSLNHLPARAVVHVR